MRKPYLLLALLAFGCGVGPDDVGTSEEALSNGWSSDVQIPSQYTTYAPALTAYGDRVHMVYMNAFPGTPELEWSQFDGSRWTSPVGLGFGSSYGPALVDFQNHLTVVYNAGTHLMMSILSGYTWSAPVAAGTDLGVAKVWYAPSAVVLGSNLYVAYCKHIDAGDDRVHIDRFNGTSWSNTVDLRALSGSTCKHVALGTRSNGRLEVVYDVSYYPAASPSFEEYAMYDAVSSSTLQTWVTTTLPMKSKKPPSIVTCGGVTHLVHGGFSTEDEVWWSYLSGETWSTNQKLATHSDGGAALGCLNGTTPIMAHDGGTTQLWYEEFYP